MIIKVLMLSTLFFIVCLPAVSQENNAIDFDKIHQKKIRKLLHTGGLSERTDFNKLQVGCSIPNDESFSRHKITYLVKKSPEEVWKAYKNASPSQSWNGKMATFGLLFSSESTPLVYAHEKNEEIKPGQIFYIQLKLFSGFYKLAVANKVVDVDNDDKRLTICYLKNGASEGSQYIHLTESKEGYTIIEHESFFKSKSKLRDRRFYPNIHAKIISEYHENIASSIGSTLYSF